MIESRTEGLVTDDELKEAAKELWHGRKDDADKPRWDLLPEGIETVVAVLTYGAKKYAPDNWRQVDNWRSRYFRAAIGHLWSYWRGETMDPESKLPHLAHAACCVLFLLTKENPIGP